MAHRPRPNNWFNWRHWTCSTRVRSVGEQRVPRYRGILSSLAAGITAGITAANALPYALCAYASTRNLHTARRLGEALEAGRVGINHYDVSQPEMPFGGWKEGGIGQEMGSERVLHYTEIKTVTVGVPA